MTITLEALQIVDGIARRGSFAAAAAALGKVPSALTYAVRKLEDELDVLIFDRRGQRARLTPAGEELLRQGRELLRAADELECRVKGVASGWETELRVAADALVSFDRLRPLIEDFDRLAAPTQLRLRQEVLHGGWDALLTGRADLVIGVPLEAPAEAFADPRFATRALGEMRFVYCVAPHHPLAKEPDPLPSEMLQRHRAVALADTSRGLPAGTYGLLSGQALLTVATLEQKIAAQIAGLGVGFLPEPFARPQLTAGRLVQKTLEQPRAPARLRVAWRAVGRGKALDWWLSRLEVARVRERLLAGPAAADA